MSRTRQLVAAFDDSVYLRANADLTPVAGTRGVSFGWQHFVESGHKEGRPGAPDGLGELVRRIAEAGLREPLPPAALRKRVNGSDDTLLFNNVGALVSWEMFRELARRGVELTPETRVLDFGCGCGRILRYFHHLMNLNNVVGTDIDADAVRWCGESLGHMGRFVVNDRWPPLPFPGGSFDLVYSVSIFTHLPEDMELAWLAELQRVTRPGGHLLLTVVGRDYFMSVREKRSAKSLTGRMKRLRMLLNPACMLDPRDRIWDPRAVKHFEQTGFYYLRGSGTKGLPGFYQGSFHTEQYLRERWGSYFEIVAIVGKGIGNCQDLVLCRRRG